MELRRGGVNNSSRYVLTVLQYLYLWQCCLLRNTLRVAQSCAHASHCAHALALITGRDKTLGFLKSRTRLGEAEARGSVQAFQRNDVTAHIKCPWQFDTRTAMYGSKKAAFREVVIQTTWRFHSYTTHGPGKTDTGYLCTTHPRAAFYSNKVALCEQATRTKMYDLSWNVQAHTPLSATLWCVAFETIGSVDQAAREFLHCR